MKYLFEPHPCGVKDCEQYGKCNQFECEEFRQWFNNVYQQMMVMNHLYDEGRLAILKENKDVHSS